MSRQQPSRRVAAAILAVATALAGSAGAPAGRDAPPRLQFNSDRIDPVIAADRLLAVTDAGNVRIVLSNSGTFGTAFQSRETPSFEWPARSGIDHLVRGSVWVGAIAADNGDTLVTIGGRDAQYTDPVFQYSEWTPVGGRPQEFSRLRTSPFFRRGTVADETYHTVYVDTLPISKDRADEPHTPAGLRIVQETYTWGFDPLDDFIVVEVNVINTSMRSLQDVWIGIYTELVTNNRQANWPAWPPGGRWFDFQDPTWDAERHMLVNRNVERRFVSAETRAALKVLGSGGRGPYGRGPDSLATKQITLTAWNWNPAMFQTWSDDSLYARMSTGRIVDLETPEFEPSVENNPVSILAVGPFADLAPGDTTQVVLAFLAGEDQADLVKNAFWAQKAYDDAYALPSPPSPPKLHVYPRHNELVLRWSADPETETDPATRLPDFQGYRVYLSESPLSSQYRLVRQVDVVDGEGFDTGLDVVRSPQPFIDGPDTLHYVVSLPGIPDGFKRYVTVTSYDFQLGEPRSLESGVLTNSVYAIAGPDAAQARSSRVSVFPNPYRGESAFDGRDSQGGLNPRKRVLWFVNLPRRSRLRIYTLAGDIVRTYDHDAATYRGTEALGIAPDNADQAQGRFLVTGGSMTAFDLLSDNRQEIASGLYLFSVEDLDTGDKQQGKFLVLK
jgi:hypothetical protein